MIDEATAHDRFEIDRTPTLPTCELSIPKDSLGPLCASMFNCLVEMLKGVAGPMTMLPPALHVLRYRVGPHDRLEPHVDASEWTAIGYPMSCFTGGSLSFPVLGISMEMHAGLVVAFPGDEAHLHGSTPVTSGEKLAFTVMSPRAAGT